MAEFKVAFLEGHLEEQMARRLLREVGLNPDHLNVVVAGGSSAFWQGASRYNRVAQYVGYVFGLTDLDSHPCPSGLISEKLDEQLDPRFALRIQVRELESWLLADDHAWSEYLGISASVVPVDPESLEDSKRELVNLARRCRRKSLRDDIVPKEGTSRQVGPGYSTRITEFIHGHWSPRRAAIRSPSLKRAIIALEQVARAPAHGSEVSGS